MGASTTTGTQSLDRALRLLKLVAAQRAARGWRLSDLAEHCQLEKSTAHRLLAFLERERLVVRRSDDRRFLPGPLLFELSVTLKPYFDLVHAAQSSVDRIASRSGCMTHLLIRSDAEFVCVVRSGGAIIKAPSIEVGTRRPLLASAGGIAMLASLPLAEGRRVIARNVRDLRYAKSRVQLLRRLVPAARRAGFCFIEGQFVTGIHAIAVPVTDSAATPIASLSAVAPAHILPRERVDQIHSWLRAESSELAPLVDQIAIL